VLLLGSALFLGFLHGLGADHLMAIAALSLAPAGDAPARQRTRALGIALRFAIGHSVLLALGAGALIALGWSLPLVVERAGEMLGGLLLIALGGVGLWGVLSGRVYGHAHERGHEQHPERDPERDPQQDKDARTQPASYWHLHIGRFDRHPLPSAHSHVPTILGAAFAVSSLRALTMLAPFGEGMAASPLPTLLLLIAVFGVGILISMSLFGVAFARVMSAAVAARLGQAAGILMAVASISLGMYWVAMA
jgi:nickel/cobalt transporter (NicO) family protein